MPGSQREGSEIQSAYYAKHDLREVYSRDNTERRRMGGHTLRKHLTAAQERKMTQAFVAIRDEYDIRNNSDAVIVWVQQQVAAGNAAEFDARLLDLAKAIEIPKRDGPFTPEN